MLRTLILTRRYTTATPHALGRGGRKGKELEEIYTRKTPREHVLLRPDTYIGSVESQRTKLWALSPEGDASSPRLTQETVEYVPGLAQILDELIVNAGDNAARDASMKQLRIWADVGANAVSIYNDGAGIPTAMHAKENTPIPQLIFGSLLSGSNFDDSQAKVTGGRNGYGAKLANIFSSSFALTTKDASSNVLYSQVWSDNMTQVSDPVLTPLDAPDLDQAIATLHPPHLAALPALAAKAPSFTLVTAHPDLPKFGLSSLGDDAVLTYLERRAYDMAAVLGPRVKVYYNNARVPVSNFREYITTFDGCTRQNTMLLAPNDAWTIGVSLAPQGATGFAQASFVNGIATTRGGRHVDHVADQISSGLAELLAKAHPELNITPALVKASMLLVVKASIHNPTFDSQTKDFLTTKIRDFGSVFKVTRPELRRALAKAPDLEAGLVERASAKSASSLARKMSATKRKRLTGIPKLEDAAKAGTKKSTECTLILTEGDSAKALAVAGLSVVGRDTYGVFPLKGKLLNVRDASQATLTKNAELNNIITILGLKLDADYSSDSAFNSLRYGRIMLMTDQDVDGSHIKGLFLNFLAFFFPSLVSRPGFLVSFVTPLVKATPKRKKKGSQPLSFYTLPEFEAWKRSSDVGAYAIKYYKGLGTSSAAEAKQYFSALTDHTVPFSWEGPGLDGSDSSALVDMAFRKSRAEDRKAWLSSASTSALEAPEPLYTPGEGITVPDFVNRELILFSLADNVRSIPSVVDGLKPGQRKVLHASRQRKLLDSELKVAQLAGFVSETTGYHHGEASLASTIIGMAQDFVGSNNIPLLLPEGQFGTRLQGGKDAASPRYIFTRLSPLTSSLLPAADDDILTHVVDDGGSPIEPQVFLPVIPLLLVNGAEGIGTGWSTSIPKYNPHTLIAHIRASLQASKEELPPLHPWVAHFKGSITPNGPNKYAVQGSYTESSPSTVTITELPAGVWTQPYKEWLEKQVLAAEADGLEKTSSLVAAYTEGHTDVDIKFDIDLTPAGVAALKAGTLLTKLKLVGSLSTTNMHAFDTNGKMARFSSPAAIIKAFSSVRLSAYADRRRAELTRLAAETDKLTSQIAFLDAIAEDGVASVLAGGPDAVSDALTSRGAPKPDPEFIKTLLSLPISGLTSQRRDRARARLEGIRDEQEWMASMTETDLWLSDLDVLEQALHDHGIPPVV